MANSARLRCTRRAALSGLQKREAGLRPPGQGPASALPIQSRGLGAEPGKSSGSRRVGTGVRVAAGSGSAAASAFPRGVHGASAPARPAAPRRTAPPRKWTPAAGLCQPARPRRGHWPRPVRREVGPTLRPAAGAAGGSPRPARGPGRAAAGPGRPRPRRADGGLRLRLPRGKQFRSRGRTPGSGSPASAPAAPGRGLGPQRASRPRPAARTVREPCACERQDSGKGRRSFNLIKFQDQGCHLRFPKADRA